MDVWELEAFYHISSSSIDNLCRAPEVNNQYDNPLLRTLTHRSTTAIMAGLDDETLILINHLGLYLMYTKFQVKYLNIYISHDLQQYFMPYTNKFNYFWRCKAN